MENHEVIHERQYSVNDLEDDNLVEINGYKYSDPLLVDCDVKISPGKGYGLFAKHNIQKGTVLFREEDVIEKDMDKINAINWLKTLTKKECAHVLHHAYVNDDRFVWCRSVVAFINHSSIFANHELIEGNLDGDNKSGVWKTTRDVNQGDELLVDYGVFGDEPEWFRALFMLVDQPYPSVEWMNDIELQNLKKVRSDSFAVELAEKVVVNGDEYANCMLVDCDVKISPGKGYGLFAKHNIPKGTVLFREEDVIEKDMDKIKVIS